MRRLLILIFLAIIGVFGYGLYVGADDPKTSEFCIGISVVGLFFVWMPLFIYHRWRKKDIKDYMLTKENIDKMREEARDKEL
ncbi:MAG: hypothetical protein AAF466_03775 [Bacteroidota bacterium]